MASKTYWENVYAAGGGAPQNSSLFAQMILAEYAKPGQKIFELGCGNGRDARFFAAAGLQVTAVDQCSDEIKRLQKENPEIDFRSADFTNLAAVRAKYNLVYSRFTLHSVSAAGQEVALRWAAAALKSGGYLCIEARGYRNSLYQKGQPVAGEDDAFVYDAHYRRFINIDSLREQLKKLGLQEIIAEEARGFAPYNGTDDYFIRVIVQK